jgi:hypothetical protein
MLRLGLRDARVGVGWHVVTGLSLLLAMGVTGLAPGQQLPSDDDLFGSSSSSREATEEATSDSEQTSQIPAPRLVRVVQDAKILYPDRTRKIVYDCKLYSDDSRVYHGKYVEYYRNGQEFCRGQYEDGRRQGKWAFRHEDGSVGKEGSYADDKPTGKWVIFRPDGSPLREEMYKDGLPHGKWLVYAPDGKTVVNAIEFAEGKLVTE